MIFNVDFNIVKLGFYISCDLCSKPPKWKVMLHHWFLLRLYDDTWTKVQWLPLMAPSANLYMRLWNQKCNQSIKTWLIVQREENMGIWMFYVAAYQQLILSVFFTRWGRGWVSELSSPQIYCAWRSKDIWSHPWVWGLLVSNNDSSV